MTRPHRLGLRRRTRHARSQASPFGGLAETRYSNLYFKAANCQARGALGMLLITTPTTTGYPDRAWRVSREQAFLESGIPICQVTSEAAKGLLAPAKMDPVQLQEEIDADYTPRSFDMPESRVEMKAWLAREPTDLYDLVGYIPGESKEVVLVLAHYDGPGMGFDNAGRIVHPAANEATGVATMLEIAAALRRTPRPHHAIVFAAVSGYHLFSSGAAALAASPFMSDKSIAAVVELGNLGRAEGGKTHLATLQADEAALTALAEAIDDVTVEIDPHADLIQGDAITFRGSNAPLVLIRGGWFSEDQTPDDTLARLDSAAVGSHAKYACALIQMYSREGP